MVVYFCDGCEAAWEQNKIMDCDLCKMYIQNGWKISDLKHVYGARYSIYRDIGLPLFIYPPHTSNRNVLEQQFCSKIFEGNLQCFYQPYHLLNNYLKKHISKEMKEELLKLHVKGNKDQAECFINQELYLVKEIGLASDFETKKYLFRALDPLTQSILTL